MSYWNINGWRYLLPNKYCGMNKTTYLAMSSCYLAKLIWEHEIYIIDSKEIMNYIY